MTMQPKNQRLVLVVLAVFALGGAAFLALLGLQDRVAYFVTPSDIAAGKAEPDEALRLGGMVREGSVVRGDDGLSVDFLVYDESQETPVFYRGILPDLFKEGSGVVAEGRLDRSGTFQADTILAKHDERYMPPQLGEAEATTQTLAP